jgi:putative Mg2+ transporter-C (MgtC) family protein
MVSELIIALRLVLAVLLGSIIGWEREQQHRPAGLRTHMLVALGSALFTVLSINAFPGDVPGRVAANIIVGIGFIGAGTVMVNKEKIIGLTTAASLWVTAAIGMAAGSGFYLIAIVTSIIAFATLFLREIESKLQKK